MTSTVQCEDGSRITGLAGSATSEEELLASQEPKRITWLNGIMELVGVPIVVNSVFDATEGIYVDEYGCGWCVISFNAAFKNYDF